MDSGCKKRPQKRIVWQVFDWEANYLPVLWVEEYSFIISYSFSVLNFIKTESPDGPELHWYCISDPEWRAGHWCAGRTENLKKWLLCLAGYCVRQAPPNSIILVLGSWSDQIRWHKTTNMTASLTIWATLTMCSPPLWELRWDRTGGRRSLAGQAEKTQCKKDSCNYNSTG